jgi:hypothetical protein
VCLFHVPSVRRYLTDPNKKSSSAV